MSWTTLGTMIDSMGPKPQTRQEIYKAGKCSVEPCRSCAASFAYTWRLARKMGLIVRVGRKFALQGWDRIQDWELEP
jgi:hypothetical protein